MYYSYITIFNNNYDTITNIFDQLLQLKDKINFVKK